MKLNLKASVSAVVFFPASSGKQKFPHFNNFPLLTGIMQQAFETNCSCGKIGVES